MRLPFWWIWHLLISSVCFAAGDQASFPADQFGRPDKTAQQANGTRAAQEALGGDSAKFEAVASFASTDHWRLLGRSVGMLDLLVRSSGGIDANETCTATLIAADRVITNYHCLPGTKAGSRVIQAWLYLGYLERLNQVGERFTVDVTPIEADKTLDYAILRVSGVPAARYPPIPLQVGTPESDQSLYVLHYPLSYPEQLTRVGCRAASPSVNPSTGEYVHYCDTRPGSSGALLLDQDAAIVALHRAGVDDVKPYNLATPMQRLMMASTELKRIAALTPNSNVQVPETAKFDYGGTFEDYGSVAAQDTCKAAARAAGDIEWRRRLDAAKTRNGAPVAAAWASEGPKFEACVYVASADVRAKCKADLERFISAAKALQATVAGGTWSATTGGVQCTVDMAAMAQPASPPQLALAEAVLAELTGASPPADGDADAQSEIDAVLGVVVRIPGGTFKMGTIAGAGEDNEHPQHTVTVSTFWLMESEVTQAMWQSVMGPNPSNFGGCPSCPVEGVSWDDAVDFARRVSAKTGQTWRLPTEAEWEYAARGGQEFAYAGSASVDAVAWYYGNADSRTHLVCGKQRNGYGLCDMTGNVWEWVSDWYADAYRSAPATNPAGPTSGAYRVQRGGSWSNGPPAVRLAFRDWHEPGDRTNNLGFRLAR